MLRRRELSRITLWDGRRVCYAFLRDLIYDVEHAKLASFMAAIFEEVIGLYVIGVLYTGAPHAP
jgi:hypothetical protein